MKNADGICNAFAFIDMYCIAVGISFCIRSGRSTSVTLMTHLSLVLHCSNLCVEVSTMNGPCKLVDTIETAAKNKTGMKE